VTGVAQVKHLAGTEQGIEEGGTVLVTADPIPQARPFGHEIEFRNGCLAGEGGVGQADEAHDPERDAPQAADPAEGDRARRRRTGGRAHEPLREERGDDIHPDGRVRRRQGGVLAEAGEEAADAL
jgi:hypothetical protein